MSENPHPRADAIDSLTTLELVTLMHEEDLNAVASVEPALPRIAEAVELVSTALHNGGRLHLFGAGTSGQIAALEAAECPATFGVAKDLVQAHVASDGEQEDDRQLGESAAERSRLGADDVVVGVSASGSTPYVVGAFEVAGHGHARRVAVVCRMGSPLARTSDVAIEVETGAEVIAGSTRLKAGTAQKIILNTLTTAVFTRLGHTHRGRMVSVVASNAKLQARAARIVAELGEVSEREAVDALTAAGGDVKVAIVVARRGLTAEQARDLLIRAGGNLESVLGGVHR